MHFRNIGLIMISIIFTLVAAQCSGSETRTAVVIPTATSSKIQSPTELIPSTSVPTLEPILTPTLLPNIPELDGSAILEKSCIQCHTLDRVTRGNKDVAGWQATVERMLTKGAILTDAEKVFLIQYLADNY